MSEQSGKTALITGASAGIGKELAILHAAEGGNLVLVARRGCKGWLCSHDERKAP